VASFFFFPAAFSFVVRRVGGSATKNNPSFFVRRLTVTPFGSLPASFLSLTAFNDRIFFDTDKCQYFPGGGNNSLCCGWKAQEGPGSKTAWKHSHAASTAPLQPTTTSKTMTIPSWIIVQSAPLGVGGQRRAEVVAGHQDDTTRNEFMF